MGELLDWTVAKFTEIGIQTPRVDAEHLLAEALSCSRMELYLQHDRLLDAHQRGPFREYVRRRLAHEPVAHILGRRGFHALDLELQVDARALIPRPETEHLVDWVLEQLPAERPAVLDVGTGTGAIAFAIKYARADARVTAIDISEEALALARENQQRLGLEVTLVAGDLVADLAARGLVPEPGFVAIAANLPYVDHGAFFELDPEVERFEPRLALDGGRGGLQLIERLIQQLAEPGILAPEGRLYLEIGHGQRAEVEQSLQRAGFVDIEAREDYADIPRVIAARQGGGLSM